MLLALMPHSLVLSAIGPPEHPRTLHSILKEAALVASAVLPGYFALPAHLVMLPLAFVGLLITPDIGP